MTLIIKHKNLVMRWFGVFLLAVAATSLSAQVRYGFKTGLNFAHISGPSEMSDAGAFSR